MSEFMRYGSPETGHFLPVILYQLSSNNIIPNTKNTIEIYLMRVLHGASHKMIGADNP